MANNQVTMFVSTATFDPTPLYKKLDGLHRLEIEIRERLAYALEDKGHLDSLLTARPGCILSQEDCETYGRVEAYARILDRGRVLGAFEKGSGI